MTESIRNLTRRDQKGFTLIELLVVIAIIAILVALILVALNAAQRGSRDSKRQSNLNQFKTALANYASANGGNYPTGVTANSMSGLCTALTGYVSNCSSLYTDPNPSTWYFNGDASGFNICVVSERDSARMFGAGPTTTRTDLTAGSANCTGIG